MSTKQYCVCDLIDLASNQKGRKARVLKRRLRNAKFREEFEDEITERLCQDSRVVGIVPVMESAGFDKTTMFAVEGEGKLEKLLQIILEYGPQIMEFIVKYILPLFASIGPFVLCLALPAVAAAQTTVCENGVCHLVVPVGQPSVRGVNTQGITLAPGEKLISVGGVPVTQVAPIPKAVAVAKTVASLPRQAIAQARANTAARLMLRNHPPGSFGSGFEGFGYSSRRVAKSLVRTCAPRTARVLVGDAVSYDRFGGTYRIRIWR